MAGEDPAGRQSGAVSELAASTSRLAGAASRWELRYDGRADHESRHVLDQVSRGVLDLGPGMRGADGVLYRAGGYSHRSQLHGTAVVLVQARGGCELLTGWELPLAAWDWVRGRLPSADGPLHVPEGCSSRTAREEQLLAWGLRYPWELDWMATMMRGHVFSCDARDEIFAAAVYVFCGWPSPRFRQAPLRRRQRRWSLHRAGRYRWRGMSAAAAARSHGAAAARAAGRADAADVSTRTSPARRVT